MASAVRESISVPKPEIISFSGDPKDYHRFMRCFEANIDKRVEDSGLKLNYLIQFCNGEAKEAIQDCVILNPEEGYERAKNILKNALRATTYDSESSRTRANVWSDNTKQ